MSAETLPEYRVKARNTSANGENPIHDDAVAQKYGFRGALVPGVTVYAYLTHALAQGLGTSWLERGTATVRFLRPVLPDEEVTVTGSVTARDAEGVTITVGAGTPATPECAVATAGVPAGTPTPVNLSLYGVAPLPATRPPVSREHLAGLALLGTPETVYDEAQAAAYVEKVSDDLLLYRGGNGWVHPAFYLDQANRALDRNVRLGPWVHVASTIRHLGGARVGDTLATCGRVRSLYTRKGREYVELDLAVVVRGRAVAHILHTAIYQLPPPGA